MEAVGLHGVPTRLLLQPVSESNTSAWGQSPLPKPLGQPAIRGDYHRRCCCQLPDSARHGIEPNLRASKAPECTTRTGLPSRLPEHPVPDSSDRPPHPLVELEYPGPTLGAPQVTTAVVEPQPVAAALVARRMLGGAWARLSLLLLHTRLPWYVGLVLPGEV